MKYHKYLVFDFETTGLKPQDSQVIEFGGLVYEMVDGQLAVTEEINLLVKCPYPLPKVIKDLTNITDEMLARDGVLESELFKTLDGIIDDETLLIAYNAAFDLTFLQALYRKFHSPFYTIKNDVLDVMTIYKDRYQYPHKLDNAVATYKVNMTNTHRALDDVKATYAVLKEMKKELNNIQKYINILSAHPKYGYSGPRLSHIKPVVQYGGRREVEKL